MEPARKLDTHPGNGGLPSLAQSDLAVALARHGLSVTVFARLVGVHRSSLHNWWTGTTRPRVLLRRRVVAGLEELSISPTLLFPQPDGTDPMTVTDLAAERKARGLSTPTPTPPPTDPQEEQVQVTSREYLEARDLEHFQLGQDPFDDPTDPEDVWLPNALQHIEVALFGAANRRQMVALTGEPGSGKSTLLRRFHGRFGNQKRIKLVSVASLDRKRIDSGALATAILRDLIGRDCATMAMEKRSELLRTTLEDQDRSGNRPVLYIDEAHLLPPKALVAIKQIWDSHTLFRQLAVFLVGQQGLERRLRNDPAVREVTGRTRILTIPPVKDAGEYLRWRFARVGGDADAVFAPDAYKALAVAGKYPLWINNLASHSMRLAVELGYEKVDQGLVGRVG